MRKYLISENGNFYKANLHCHSTLSDGKLTPVEIKDLYKRLGYSIVAYTDHDILIPHDDLTDDEFLALHGFEVEITRPEPPLSFAHLKSCHMCFIGIDPDNIIQPMWHRRWYLFGNSLENIGMEIIFHNDDDPQVSPDFIDRLHRDGKLTWANSIIYNHRSQIAAGHSDDTSLLDSPDKGWGWLAERGFDLIQTDWPIMMIDYLKSAGLYYKK